MVNLLTNTAAMSALRLLAGTQKALGTVQAQMSTGLKVARASDDAAYWSIGETMRATTSGLAAGEASLSLEMGVLQTAQAALGLIRRNVVGIGDDLVQALQPGVDDDAIEADVAARQAAVVQEGNGASFGGVNVLVDQFDYGGYNEDQWGNTSSDPGVGRNSGFAYQVPTGITGDPLALNGLNLFATLFGDHVLEGGAYGSLISAPARSPPGSTRSTQMMSRPTAWASKRRAS